MTTDNHTSDHGKPAEPLHWIEKPQNVTRIVYALYAISAFLIAIDIFIPKHGTFAIEHWWGFYAIYGFVGCVALVLISKFMRRFLMRGDNYYDR